MGINGKKVKKILIRGANWIGDSVISIPAIKTVRMTKMTIPYKPAPTPPKTTSPSIMLIMAIIPLRGDRLSCMALTDPFDAAVVEVDQIKLFVIPKRVSLPSINERCPKTGFDAYSAYNEIANPEISKIIMAVKIVHPWRVDPTILP